MDWKGSITIKTILSESKSFLMDIGLITFDETSALSFFVGNDDFKEEFTLDISTTGYAVSHKNGSIISIRFSRGREILLKDFFQRKPSNNMVR